MKKILSVIFMFTSVLLYSQQATLTLPVDNGYSAGETVTVPIVVSDLGGGTGGVSGFLYSVYFDETVLTYTGYQNLHPNADGSYYAENLLPGEWRGSWLDVLSLSSFFVAEDDVMIELLFTYNGPGGCDLTFGTGSKVVDNLMVKGNTEMTDENFAGYVLTLEDGSVNMMPTLTTWTGTTSVDWDDATNWSDGVPVDMVDASIPDVAPAFFPEITGPGAATDELTIASGASLTVGPGGELTTGGLFTNDGSFDILSENLDGYAGSFIDMGGLAGTGTFSFNRMVLCSGSNPANPGDPFGWHYLAGVIDGMSTDDMLDYYINEWDEPTGMWNSFEGTSPCIPYAPAQSLDGLDVWSINRDSEYACPDPGAGENLLFEGPFTSVHTGPFSAPATVSAGAFAGWNMFANPYPSGLMLDQVVWDAGAVPGAAFYDGCSGNYEYWTPALGAQTCAPGIGFFTEFTAAGTFDLAGTERGHAADWWWKDELSKLLTLQATGENTSDVTHIRFLENAEVGFAKDGDFHKLISTKEGLPQIYTTAGADKLAVNARPATNKVPMAFTASTSGTYSIEAIQTSDFNEVYLQDLVTGQVTNMLTDAYSFDYTTGDDADRFMVHFETVGIDDSRMGDVSIWSAQNNIYVDVPKELKGTITVFNLMGQEVISTDTQPGTNVITIDEVNTYYIVKVISSDRAITGKVYIK